MVRAYTYALLACVCFFLNLNCERTLLPVDSSKKIDYEQADTKARVILKVFDQHTMAPISGATVSIIGVDSSFTDTKGTVIFDSIKPGDYIITCSKAGFEEIYDQLSLTLDSNSNTVPIVNQSSNGYFMAKKGAAVRGNIYYGKDGKYYPANGVTIECKLNSPDNQLFQNPVKTTTSSNGFYIFTDLPEYTGYTITVRFFSDGTLSYSQNNSLSLNGKSVGDTIRAEDIILEKIPDGEFRVLSHNLETFTRSESIVLEFSEAVDTSKLSQDSIVVYIGTEENRILIQKQWQNGNKKLLITPYDGSWDPFDIYTLKIKKIVSIAGKRLNNTNFLARNFTPITAGALGNVMNLTALDAFRDTSVDFNTSSIILNWSPLANALYYQIYQKRPSDSSWIFLETTNDTFTTLSTGNGSFESGKQLKYIVLGENSTNISPLNTATALTVKDQMPPRINSTMILSGFDNTGNVTAKFININIPVSYLPEPLDTTIKPTLKVAEGSYLTLSSIMYGDSTYKVAEAYSRWTWLSQRSGVMEVLINEDKDGSYDTLSIDFTGLTDIAGNKADTTYGAGVITILTRP